MKRLIALAALLLAASACTTTTENVNTGAGNTNANANANAAASPTPAGVSQADIEAKERQVYDAIKSKNWDAFAGFLSDNFTWVSEDGVHDKAATVEGIKKYDLAEYAFSDMRLVKVDDDLVVFVYTMTEKSTYDGKPSDGRPTYAASAWASRGGQWVAVYHQDTLSAPPPNHAGGANANSVADANRNGNANAAANANASAANANAGASPAPASAADAEKAVWDALKTKNFDAFANFLAADAVEIEPEGIFTKAQSIEGVRHVDFSKVTLSDLKEMKLDADSTLVTYLVKSPSKDWPPAGMRHSTIWNNRGGRWQAYFHQGTTQTTPGK